MTHAQVAGTNALDLVGNTPLVELRDLVPSSPVRVFAKLEWCNPGGSVKDRPARQMILDAIEAGKLRPGAGVLEATSGNTGSALAYVCRVLEIPLTVVVPEATSARKREDMERFGATLVVVPGDTTERALEVAYKMVADEPGRFYMTDQYTNPSNPRAHYLTTAPEILRQCPGVTHVVAAQGSFGTLGGIGRRFREERPEVKMCSVVARPGVTTLFGMKEEHITMPLVDDSILSARWLVTGYDAIRGIEAGYRYGFQLGPSAAGVLAAVIRFAERSTEPANVVCIFADSGAKYPGCELYDRNASARLSGDEADRQAFSRW